MLGLYTVCQYSKEKNLFENVTKDDLVRYFQTILYFFFSVVFLYTNTKKN